MMSSSNVTAPGEKKSALVVAPASVYAMTQKRYPSNNQSTRKPRSSRTLVAALSFVCWWLLVHRQVSNNVGNYIVSLHGNIADHVPSSDEQHRYDSRRPHHAIVVPFRNRTSHLEQFIAYMGPYLKRNFPHDDFSLYVMEQADNDHFNRGFLFNAGLTLLHQQMPATHCVVLHDVDLVPRYNNDNGGDVSGIVPYTDCSKPIQLGSELEHFNWTAPYSSSCGGITSMHTVDWWTINGMSNDYEGWGGEDDDLYHRLLRNHLLRGGQDNNKVIRRPPRGKGAFVHLEVYEQENVTTTIKDEHNNVEHNKTVQKKVSKRDLNPHWKQNHNTLKAMRNQTTSDRWKHDGLNDLNYTIVHQATTAGTEFFEIHHVKVLGQLGWTPPAPAQ